jgi:hypothetical protein
MSGYNSIMKYYTLQNDDRYSDNLVDDKLDFEDEINNIDNINRQYLNLEIDDSQLIGNENNGLLNAIFNEENNKNISVYQLNNKDLQQVIHIYKTKENIINKIYLEIELEENTTFDEISNTTKIKLFETLINFTIGGANVIKSTILTNLFMLFSQDINMKQEGNIIQIPILDFNMTKTEKINLKEHESGFPNSSLFCHDVGLNITFKTTELFKYMKFNIKVCGRYLIRKMERYINSIAHEYIFLMSFHDSDDNMENISISYSLEAKCIIIYFIPLNDDYIDYPQIESIEIYKDGNIYIIESSELLYMELFDIIYTVIPLSDDFASWKNINRTLKNPHKYLTSNGMSYENKFKLHINYSLKPTNFVLNYNVVIPNIFRIISGMGGYVYC